VERPSTVTGANYDAVSLAYVQAVHSVLSGHAKSPEAAAGLEKELVRITGFEPVRK
jgi:trehalose/maltose transport system substrate-binding protein